MTTPEDRPRTALLVVDVRRDGADRAHAVVGGIAALVERARRARTPVARGRPTRTGVLATPPARVVGPIDLHRGFHTGAVRTAGTAGVGRTGAQA